MGASVSVWLTQIIFAAQFAAPWTPVSAQPIGSNLDIETKLKNNFISALPAKGTHSKITEDQNSMIPITCATPCYFYFVIKWWFPIFFVGY